MTTSSTSPEPAPTSGVCSIHECGQPVHREGKCHRHWVASKSSPCAEEGCQRPVRRAGLCHRHLEAKRAADAAVARCSYGGCTQPVSARGLCRTHYNSAERLRDVDDVPTSSFHLTQDGTAILSGYGVFLKVVDAHLIIGTRDGGQLARFSRADGLRRVVVVGTSGSVSLTTLWYLSKVGATLSVVDLDGTGLTHGGPEPRDDSRLRRAQATLPWTPGTLLVAQHLITAKLAGSADVLGLLTPSPAVSTASLAVASARERVSVARSLEDVLTLERDAGLLYHRALAEEPVRFRQPHRVPAHWLRWGPRRSAVTGIHRQASTPANALYNFCIGLAIIEVTTALAAVGLDAGVGLGLHAEVGWRASASWDVVEAIRPQVAALVLNILRERTWTRQDFHELPAGEVRLLPQRPVVAPDRKSAPRSLAAEVTRRLRQDLRRTGIVARTVEDVTRIIAAHELAPPSSRRVSTVSTPTLLTRARQTAARAAQRR